ncbi:C45 family autoproteolytic acyltransferase/hydolase [Streptomyces sp. SYSU K21746]
MSARHTRFVSTAVTPRERGREFGETWRSQVAGTVDAYRVLFTRSGVSGLDGPGAAALAAAEEWAPDLAAEIRGIAEGAALPVTAVAAINARTEILAGRAVRPPASVPGPGSGSGSASVRAPAPGECTTLVALRGPGEEPLAVQNWDWYAGLADNWLEWEIPHASGRRTVTLTEYGIVGKIGINDRGVGALFNILHHRHDGGAIGVPVHVVARRLLDEAGSVTDALRILGSARVSASTTITAVGGLRAGKTAIATELWPGGPGHVLPDPDGLLLHTNHFLTQPGAPGDTEPVTAPDTLVRYEVLRRRLTGRGPDLTEAEAREALSDHTGPVCVHAASGRPDEFQTLATAQLDFTTCGLRISAGPPCEATPSRATKE